MPTELDRSRPYGIVSGPAPCGGRYEQDGNLFDAAGQLIEREVPTEPEAAVEEPVVERAYVPVAPKRTARKRVPKSKV